MKFIVDMPLSPGIVRWLRSHGHDAVHADELSRARDEEILAVAIDEERVITDLDFPRLFAKITANGPGLILLRGGNYMALGPNAGLP